jgi:DNA-binding CsgD family transcriptional regulator
LRVTTSIGLTSFVVASTATEGRGVGLSFVQLRLCEQRVPDRVTGNALADLTAERRRGRPKEVPARSRRSSACGEMPTSPDSPLPVDPLPAGQVALRRAERLQLSERDERLLEHMSRGLTDDRIGETLHLSPETVRANVRRVVRLLGARNRTHAVALALRAGRID